MLVYDIEEFNNLLRSVCLQSLLKATPAQNKLQFTECRQVDDSVFVDKLLPYIDKQLGSFIATCVHFSDHAVEELAQKCRKLQHITVIGCDKIGPESIKSIGLYCQVLKTISFDCRNNPLWDEVSDVLSVLVKNCASELVSTTFLGFTGITDIGVTYVAECYYDSLLKVNFNNSPCLTDACIVGLVTRCSALTDVALNSAHITDHGIGLLAEKLSRLKRLDFGNCTSLTDAGIKALARRCPRLIRINLENCLRVTDGSLVALIDHCPKLQYVNLSGTDIQSVPVTILALRHLRELRLAMCKELTYPPPDITERELEGLLGYYSSYNLANRYCTYYILNIYIIYSMVRVLWVFCI